MSKDEEMSSDNEDAPELVSFHSSKKASNERNSMIEGAVLATKKSIKQKARQREKSKQKSKRKAENTISNEEEDEEEDAEEEEIEEETEEKVQEKKGKHITFPIDEPEYLDDTLFEEADAFLSTSSSTSKKSSKSTSKSNSKNKWGESDSVDVGGGTTIQYIAPTVDEGPTLRPSVPRSKTRSILSRKLFAKHTAQNLPSLSKLASNSASKAKTGKKKGKGMSDESKYLLGLLPSQSQDEGKVEKVKRAGLIREKNRKLNHELRAGGGRKKLVRNLNQVGGYAKPAVNFAAKSSY